MQKFLESFKPLVKALGKTLGKRCEVVLHDFTNVDHSIVMIVNGHVTGRQVGDPLTDLGLRILRSNQCENDALINYESTTKDGRKLRSTTIFIRRPGTKKFVGAICINFDLTDYEKMREIWEDFCYRTPLYQQISSNSENKDISETFVRSPTEILQKSIKEVLKKIGKSINILKKDDRIKLIQSLDKEGIFLIKGAVDEVARELGVSRYTVYNYLKESRFKAPKGVI